MTRRPIATPRTLGLAAALILALPAAACAQPGPDPASAEALRAACDAELRRFCAAVQLGGGRIAHCLPANSAQLTPSCRAGLDQARAQMPPR